MQAWVKKISFLGFLVSKNVTKRIRDKKLFFNRYHIIIFGNLYVQFLCPKWNRKNFQKRKSRNEKIRIIFFFHPVFSFGGFLLVTFLVKKKLFLIIIKTHVSETSVYCSVPRIIGNTA